MATQACKTLITRAPLEAPPLAADYATGAATDFWGIVRGSEEGRRIEGIDYEAHDRMAEHQLKQIALEATRQFGLNRVFIHHRIGFIAVGEPSLFVRVCSPHREKGFRACRWIVDELKMKVPIWKRARFKSDSVTDLAAVGPPPTVAATTDAGRV